MNNLIMSNDKNKSVRKCGNPNTRVPHVVIGNPSKFRFPNTLHMTITTEIILGTLATKACTTLSGNPTRCDYKS